MTLEFRPPAFNNRRAAVANRLDLSHARIRVRGVGYFAYVDSDDGVVEMSHCVG